MAKHSGVPFIFVNVSDGNEKAFFLIEILLNPILKLSYSILFK